MRNGRDRRSNNPSGPTRDLSACYCLGPISGSHQGQRPQRPHRDGGKPSGENRPYTWLHPNASQNVRFLLHRGRRPYMAHSVVSRQRSIWSLSGVKRTSTGTRSRQGRPVLVRVCRRSIHAFHNDLADAAGQLWSPESTTERATNARLLTGCTKCPMADRQQRQGQHDPSRSPEHTCVRSRFARGRGPWGELCVSYPCYRVEVSLFYQNYSLLVFIGNIDKNRHECCIKRRSRHHPRPIFAIFPVYFPVSREFCC